jgi:hypothetical protein
MSQNNRSFPPDFNLVVQGPVQQYAYNASTQQTHTNVQQQWMQPRRPSAQLNIPSPTTSVRSSVTIPNQHRPFDSSSFHQNDAVSVHSGPDPEFFGMDMLAPSGHVVRTSYSPIARNYSDESWNPFNLRTSDTSDDHAHFNQTNESLKSFRHGPSSVISAGPRSDSGFYSQSAVSHDAGRMDQSNQCSLTQQVGNLNVRSSISEAPQMMRMHSDQRSQISHTSTHSGYLDGPLKCTICGEVSKCKSDHKCVPSSAFDCTADNRRIESTN